MCFIVESVSLDQYILTEPISVNDLPLMGKFMRNTKKGQGSLAGGGGGDWRFVMFDMLVTC